MQQSLPPYHTYRMQHSESSITQNLAEDRDLFADFKYQYIIKTRTIPFGSQPCSIYGAETNPILLVESNTQ